MAICGKKIKIHYCPNPEDITPLWCDITEWSGEFSLGNESDMLTIKITIEDIQRREDASN